MRARGPGDAAAAAAASSRTSRASGHTHTHPFSHTHAPVTSLERPRRPRREAGGCGDGARDDARASARRAEAAGALRCARGGAYMRGSSYGGQRAASGVGQQGPEFELAAAAHLEGLVQKLLLRCSFIWGRRAPILANHQPQPAQNAAATAGVQKTSRISTCQGVHGAQTRASQSSCMSNLRPTYEACGCLTLRGGAPVPVPVPGGSASTSESSTAVLMPCGHDESGRQLLVDTLRSIVARDIVILAAGVDT